MCGDIFGCRKIVVLAVGLLLASTISACSNWTKENINESRRRGNEIISALEAYRAKHQSYPAKLEELVPMYLSEIKSPLAGNGQWKYVTGGNEGKGFYLGFEGNDPDTDPVSYFSSEDGKWYMDTR